MQLHSSIPSVPFETASGTDGLLASEWVGGVGHFRLSPTPPLVTSLAICQSQP